MNTLALLTSCGRRALGWLSCAGLCLLTGFAAPAEEAHPVSFEQANKLYEQGRFAEAAQAYEQFAKASHASWAVWYNLGNAWFKAGQNGRAIAAYRQAEQFRPRDSDLQFNLGFVRRKAGVSEQPVRGFWERSLDRLSLSEWAGITAGFYWIWMGLLMVGEWGSEVRSKLRKAVFFSGLATITAGTCLALAAYQGAHRWEAVVVVPKAVVRYGPLPESQKRCDFSEGTEVRVLDQQTVATGEKSQRWLQVEDAARRIGWIPEDEAVVLNGLSKQS